MHWAWVKELVACIPGETAEASMTFDKDLFFFEDHFLGDPRVPGVLQLEMIAQTAGMCIRASRTDLTTVLARILTAKFIGAIRPGEYCRVVVKVSRLGSESATIDGEIFVEGYRRCEASMRIALVQGGTVNPGMDAIFDRWQQQRSYHS
jgi:3-hydroxyacyl-[acyl-carrier-protein] dehydratase